MHFILSLFKHESNELSIHGLWPQAKTYCKCGKQFSIDNITSLLPQLHKHWRDRDHKDEQFWKHEYIKHGTCGFDSEYLYFKTTLDVFYEYIRNKINEVHINEHKITIQINNHIKW